MLGVASGSAIVDGDGERKKRAGSDVWWQSFVLRGDKHWNPLKGDRTAAFLHLLLLLFCLS